MRFLSLLLVACAPAAAPPTPAGVPGPFRVAELGDRTGSPTTPSGRTWWVRWNGCDPTWCSPSGTLRMMPATDPSRLGTLELAR